MIGAGERPDVSFESLYKFDLDGVASRWNKVADCNLQISRLKSGRAGQKSISCSGGDDGEVGFLGRSVRCEAHAPGSGVELRDARTHNAAAGLCGTFQQQA